MGKSLQATFLSTANFLKKTMLRKEKRIRVTLSLNDMGSVTLGFFKTLVSSKSKH